MYFSLLPDIKYDTKPISYPFSESDFVTAKNFFRRYKISEDIFGHATFYKKYTLQEGVKIEQIANAYYGDVFYDWVVLLTNNIINPQFGLPLDSETLRKIVEEKYGEDEAYSGIHHYETIFTLSPQKVDGIHVPVLDGGTIVDKNFYDSPFSYWNGAETVTVPGNTVSKPILNFDYEVAENEKKREIYILRKDYFYRFIEEFKQGALYSRSSDFINKRLKKTSV
tara:strand:+ start:1942 stop:2613 length:672 start_codon:yes stop_codon:yes gene_type:complete